MKIKPIFILSKKDAEKILDAKRNESKIVFIKQCQKITASKKIKE